MTGVLTEGVTDGCASMAEPSVPSLRRGIPVVALLALCAACADALPPGNVGEVEIGATQFSGTALLSGPESFLDCPYVLRVVPDPAVQGGEAVPFASVGIWFALGEERPHSIDLSAQPGPCIVRLESEELPANGRRGPIANVELRQGRLEFREVGDVLRVHLEAQPANAAFSPLRFDARAPR